MRYTLRLRRYTPPNAHEQYVHVKLRYVSAQSLTFVRFELRLLRTYTTSTQQLFYAHRSSHNAYTLSVTLIYPPRICASRLGLRPPFLTPTFRVILHIHIHIHYIFTLHVHILLFFTSIYELFYSFLYTSFITL